MWIIDRAGRRRLYTVAGVMGVIAAALLSGLAVHHRLPVGSVRQRAWPYASQPAAGGVGAARPRHVATTVHYDLLAQLLASERRARPADWWRERLADYPRIATQPHPLLEQAAPDFALRDAEGQSQQWCSPRAPRPLVLVFYLGYNCSACVHTLFDLDADLPAFRSLGAEVIAVSGDTPDVTRERFAAFGSFHFPVLSDPGHALAQAYGTYVPACGGDAEQLLHGTFVIARDGTVHWAYRGELPFAHSLALLAQVAELAGSLPGLTDAGESDVAESGTP